MVKLIGTIAMKLVPEQNVKSVDSQIARYPLVTHILACSAKKANVFFVICSFNNI